MNKSDVIIKSNAIFNGVSKTLIDGFVAVKDGKIQYVGDYLDINDFLDENTKMIDAGDQLVMPGFHDAHIHMYMSGLYASPLVHVSFTDTSAESCVAGLSELARKTPKDRWLIGAGWYYTLWDVAKLPDKKMIDDVYPDRPVCMVSADCHTLWLNSLGLEKLGLTKNSVPPKGGIYAKDEQGELTGIIQETAASALIKHIYDFKDDEVKPFYQAFMKELNSYGITSVCDVSMMSIPGSDFIREDIYGQLLGEGKMTVRVNMYPTLMKDLTRPLSLREQYPGEIVTCRGVKQFFDGVSSTHTAYLKNDYSNARFPGDRGQPTMPEKNMEELILLAHQNDLSARVHTIGDQAIHCLIDYFAKAEEVYGKKPYLQHTLEHLENLQVEDIERLAEYRIIPSVQPPHLMIDPKGIELDLGMKRVPYMWPFQSFLNAGATIALGTDSPVVEINPFYVLYNAVTRQSVFNHDYEGGWVPQEKISIFEALKAYTYGSARAASRNDVGVLAPNKLADIIILDHNLFKCDANDILKTQVILTMMDGQIVYKNKA